MAASKTSTKTAEGGSSDPFVLIAGAGIGGLAVALALHKAGHTNLRLVERSVSSPPTAAGINLQPHAVGVLYHLGIGDAACGVGLAPRHQCYFSSKGDLVGLKPAGLASNPDAYPQVSISHRELHTLLLDTVAERLGPDAIVRGLKSSSYTQDAQGGVTLELLDAETRKAVEPMRCDILIAADGIYSPLRKTMHPKDGEVARSGLTVFRGVAPFPRFLDGATMAAIGDHRQKIVCYPVAELPNNSSSGGSSGSNTQMMNFAAVVVEEPQDIKAGQQSYTEAADPEEVLRRLDAGEFGAYNLPWLDHRAMFHSAEALYSWPIVDRDPLDSWVDGCVALIGDAAHPMYPFGSNGASSALLDAKELADQMTAAGAFATRDREVLGKALLEYQNVRLPAAVAVQAACRNQGAEKVVAQYSRSKAEKAATGDGGKEGGDTGKLVREALAKAQRGADVKAKVAENVQGEDHSYGQLLEGFTADEKVVLLAKKGVVELLSAPGGKGAVKAVTRRVLPRTGANSEHTVFDLEVEAVVEKGASAAAGQKRKANGPSPAVVAVSRSAVVVKDQAKALQMMAEGMLGLQEDSQSTFKIRSLARGASKATGEPCIVRQFELSNDAVTCQTYEEIATDAVPAAPRRSKRLRS